MVINSCGVGCFKIQTGGISILIEGFGGDASGRFKPDIFIRTSKNKSNIVAEHTVSGPGEYEIKGVEINGYPPFVYLIKTEELKLGFLGGQDVDIMFVSDTPEGAKMSRQLHSPIIISTTGIAKELEKELGKKAESLEKLVIKKKEIPVSESATRLICLKS